MDLYITHFSCIPKIIEEIEDIILKKNKILIYFDQKEFSFPVKILEYVSRGEIIIRKLPEELKKCIHLIYYDIGIYIKEMEDVHFFLWEMDCFTESVEFLYMYDSNLKERLHLKKAKTVTGQKETNKETETNAIKNRNTQGKRGSKKNPKEQKSRINERRTPEKHIQKDIAYEIDLEDDHVDLKFYQKEHKDESDIKRQPESQKKEDVNVLSDFRVLLENICNESIDTLDAGTILLAVYDSLEAYSKELAFEILHKSLIESFGNETGESYYQRLLPNFDKIIEYFRK